MIKRRISKLQEDILNTLSSPSIYNPDQYDRGMFELLKVLPVSQQSLNRSINSLIELGLVTRTKM